MTRERDIHIKVPVLARVEGAGALDLCIRDGHIDDLKLRIFEPPRLFEKFLEGRDYHEVPDMVARICGICPVAYQMSAVQALEAVLALDVGPWVRDMRRLYYCGEWLQSHSLHIHLLAAPDFLGYDSVVSLARDHADLVRRGLALQALGNDIIRLLGGRSVHPVGARVGGFWQAPALDDLAEIYARLRAALPDVEGLVRWSATLPLPQVDQEFTSVALGGADDYPMMGERLVSSGGLDISIAEFAQHFVEHQVPHSTALHCLLDGRPYLVGPLARVNLHSRRLPPAVRAVLAETGIDWPSRNPFHSIVARAAEMYFAVIEAMRLVKDYRVPPTTYVEATPRAGVGYGCSEAPRGILWHRYELAGNGSVRQARIVPPTSQNQARMEEDLRWSLTAFGLERSEVELRQRGETVIRNYDPCISCATHFLDLRVRRT
jgi:coenzyme F420-reducing hydrogenase alpha subunit